MHLPTYPFFFFFNDTATTEIYTLPLHDALPISLPHGATLQPRCFAPVLHPRATGAVFHRDHGGVHPASHDALRPPSVVRRRRGRSDCRLRGSPPGARGGAGSQSRAAGTRTAHGHAPRTRRRDGRARRLDRHPRGAPLSTRFDTRSAGPSRCVRRLGRHVRDDVESAADFPAGRRAHPVRNATALAATDRSRYLDAHRRAGLLLARWARLGVSRANFVSRAPRAPAGPRPAATPADVAPRSPA